MEAASFDHGGVEGARGPQGRGEDRAVAVDRVVGEQDRDVQPRLLHGDVLEVVDLGRVGEREHAADTGLGVGVGDLAVGEELDLLQLLRDRHPRDEPVDLAFDLPVGSDPRGGQPRPGGEVGGVSGSSAREVGAERGAGEGDGADGGDPDDSSHRGTSRAASRAAPAAARTTTRWCDRRHTGAIASLDPAYASRWWDTPTQARGARCGGPVTRGPVTRGSWSRRTPRGACPATISPRYSDIGRLRSRAEDEVLPEVLDVLDADREPEQALGDGGGLGLPAAAALEGGLDAAERGGVDPQLGGVLDEVGERPPLAQHDRDHRAEAGVADLGDVGSLREPADELLGVGLGALDPQRQRAQPAQRQPGLERRRGWRRAGRAGP